MRIATIGFTQSTAESFFGRIRTSGQPLVVDVRVHNRSQLAGFAKRDDLAYFLRELCDVDYVEEPVLAPTEDLVAAYRHKKIDWEEFAGQYRALLKERDVIGHLDRARYEPGVILLCSEPKAEHCHRRFAAEYIAEHWPGVEIEHL
ncbi:MAG: DUF488 domain-containing protein [Dehalococcoidia bacterium]